MANRKISQFTTTTDITTVQGLAGYDATTNVQISGSALITSLEANLYKPFGNDGDVLTLVNGVPAWAAGGGGPGGNPTMADVYSNSVTAGGSVTASANNADLQLTNDGITITALDKGKLESTNALTLESTTSTVNVTADQDAINITAGTDVVLQSDSGNNQYELAFTANGEIRLDGSFGNDNEVIVSNGTGNQVEWGKIQLNGLNKSVNGVLEVTNGGTGVGGLTEGRLVVGGGVNALSTITSDGKGKLVVGRTVGAVNSTGIIPVGTDGQVLTADSNVAEYGVKWANPTSGGVSAFTTKAGADVIDWDYATDGPNLIVNLGSGLENKLTVGSLTNFPNGSTGFVIMNPQNSTDYKMPSEDHGSITGITSKMSGGDASLGGTNDVLWEWTYDGSTFYWQKFQNYVDPIYPPSVVFDSTGLLAFYHPESYNESVNGASLVAGTPVPNIATSILIGDLAVGSNVTNAEFYTRDDSVSRPAFWSLAGDSNSIVSPQAFAGLPVTNTVSCYIQGPFAASYSTIFDFDEGGNYQELLYINSNRTFEFSYSPAITLGYPALVDYSGNPGGADLSNEWIFISVSLDDANNEVIFYAGCQSSLDAANAAGGATNWDYTGQGDFVAVDANGLYKETNAFAIGTNNFTRFLYGQSVGSVSEGAKCHLGMLGIYSTVLGDAQVTQNWLDSRSVYYIS